MTMKYAQIELTLDSALHIGAGRSGMLAKSHAFVPGHIVSYALASAIGKANGGQYADFVQALKVVMQQTCCGPLFLSDPSQSIQVLLPKADKARLEQQFLMASTHVTLNSETRGSIDGALFEVEVISAHVLRGPYRGQASRLRGGIWFTEEIIHGRSLADWLNTCLLGGELKTGLGRIRSVKWEAAINNYAGFGLVDEQGLHLSANEIVPGAALCGVTETPFYPWVGRLYDHDKGFGRLLSIPAFVALDAKVSNSTCFIPESQVPGLGCWTLVK